MGKPLRVLLVEDSEDDALLIVERLKGDGYEVIFERVDTEEAMRAALSGKAWDIILCDYSLPRFDVSHALNVCKESRLDLPFIIVSGQIGEEAAVACMKQGAHDYVMKDKLSRLAPAIERELKEAVVRQEKMRAEESLRTHQVELTAQNEELHRMQGELEASRLRYFDLYDMAPVGYCTLSVKGLIMEANLTAATMLGVARGDLTRQPLSRFILKEDHEIFFLHIIQLFKAGIPQAFELRMVKKDRSDFWARLESTAVQDADGTLVCRVIISNIHEYKRGEAALKESELKYRSLIESSSEAIFCVDEKGEYKFTNHLFSSTFGKTTDYFIGKTFWDIYLKEHADQRYEVTKRVFQTGKSESVEVEVPLSDKTLYYLATANPIKDETGKVILTLTHATDITDRKQAEQKLIETLDRLRKAFGATVQVLVSAVETRDPYTSGHQIRSADLARAMATERGLPQDRIDGIRMAGSIHDIGKMSAPAEILSKPTKLSELEFAIIKEHAQKGFEMLKDVESPWPLAEIVYQHHERIDGSGYPRKLKGEEILMEARILAVADVVEAMASHRPYRPAIGLDAALAEIENNKGTLYDADAVDACLRLFREKGFKLEGA